MMVITMTSYYNFFYAVGVPMSPYLLLARLRMTMSNDSDDADEDEDDVTDQDGDNDDNVDDDDGDNQHDADDDGHLPHDERRHKSSSPHLMDNSSL